MRANLISLQSRVMGLPSLDGVTLPMIRQQADESFKLARDCGPFDPAYEFLMRSFGGWKRLYVLLKCEELGLTPAQEGQLRNALEILHCEVFDHTADSALDAAIACERSDALRSRGFIELATVLERWEKKS